MKYQKVKTEHWLYIDNKHIATIEKFYKGYVIRKAWPEDAKLLELNNKTWFHNIVDAKTELKKYYA